jgi:hypothetical protein
MKKVLSLLLVSTFVVACQAETIGDKKAVN